MPKNNPSMMSDHDLLIRLDTKFDELTTQIKINNDGVISKLGDHETRLKSMETLRDEFGPILIKQQVEQNTQWIHDFKLTYRTLVAIAATVGAVAGFFLSVVTQIYSFVTPK